MARSAWSRSTVLDERVFVQAELSGYGVRTAHEPAYDGGGSKPFCRSRYRYRSRSKRLACLGFDIGRERIETLADDQNVLEATFAVLEREPIAVLDLLQRGPEMN